MSKTLDFINHERETLGKTYIDIAYAINEVSPFLSNDTLSNRKYYYKSSVLKKYIDLLNEEEFNSKQKKFSFFKKDNSIEILSKYKSDNHDDINQLNYCSKCSCLNCIKECNFQSCNGCRFNSYIKNCDKKHLNVRFHEGFILDLTNNNNGKSNRYKVLSTIEDCLSKKLYIVLENLLDKNDKLILYYYPGISNDEFGEITDENEFNLIVETYEKA